MGLVEKDGQLLQEILKEVHSLSSVLNEFDTKKSTDNEVTKEELKAKLASKEQSVKDLHEKLRDALEKLAMKEGERDKMLKDLIAEKEEKKNGERSAKTTMEKVEMQEEALAALKRECESHQIQ